MKESILLSFCFVNLMSISTVFTMEREHSFQAKEEQVGRSSKKINQQLSQDATLKKLIIQTIASEIKNSKNQETFNQDPTKYCEQFDKLPEELKEEIAEAITEKTCWADFVQYNKTIVLDNIKKLAGKVFLSPDGKILIQFVDDLINFYTIKQNSIEKLKNSPLINNKNYCKVVFSSDNRTFALLPFMRRNVEVYEITKDDQYCFLGDFNTEFYINELAFDPTASQLFFLTREIQQNKNVLSVFDITTKTVTRLADHHDNTDIAFAIFKLKFIDNKTFVACFGQKICIYSVNFQDGKVQLTLNNEIPKLSEDSSNRISTFEVKDNQLFYILSDGTLGIYSLITKETIYSKKLGVFSEMHSIYLVSNNILVLVGYNDIYIYELKNKKMINLMHNYSSTMIGKIIMFNPQKTLLMYYDELQFIIVDIRNPKNMSTIFEYKDTTLPLSLACSANNQVYISWLNQTKQHSKVLLCNLEPYMKNFENLTIEKALNLVYKSQKKF